MKLFGKYKLGEAGLDYCPQVRGKGKEVGAACQGF